MFKAKPTNQGSREDQNLLASSLTYERPKIFNALPKEVTQVRSITCYPVWKFKSGVDKFLLTVLDEPQVPDYTARCWT